MNLDGQDWIWISGMLGTLVTALGAALPQILAHLERRDRLREAAKLSAQGRSARQIREALDDPDDEGRPSGRS